VTDPSPAATKAAAEKKPDVTVGIAQLLKDYKGNEVRADATYKGKRVRVTGTVDDIKKDIMDSIYVTIGTGAQFEIPQAQCYFDDDFAKKAASLEHGQKITVDCDAAGLMMNVQMKDCSLVENP